MKRVIKAFEKFNEEYREEIYAQYEEGVLARTTFPFKGEITDGVIFTDTEEDCAYLIPVSSIKASKLSMAMDDDDDDDDHDGDSDDVGIDSDMEAVEDEE